MPSLRDCKKNSFWVTSSSGDKRNNDHTRVGILMYAVSFLNVFWFVIRSMKYYFVSDINLSRQLWYWYYLPMLFIPLISIFVSMSLGKQENYRLPKWTALLYIPTVLFLLLVVTNDFHQLVFAFPAGEVWTDKNNDYVFGYYLVIGWAIICALTSFIIMVIKCRLSQRKKFLPLVLLCMTVVYAFTYASGVEWMQIIAGDITAVQCLMYTAILESCIQCGLIQTNTGYEALFESETFKAQITDINYHIDILLPIRQSSRKVLCVQRKTEQSALMKTPYLKVIR